MSIEAPWRLDAAAWTARAGLPSTGSLTILIRISLVVCGPPGEQVRWRGAAACHGAAAANWLSWGLACMGRSPVFSAVPMPFQRPMPPWRH